MATSVGKKASNTLKNKVETSKWTFNLFNMIAFILLGSIVGLSAGKIWSNVHSTVLIEKFLPGNQRNLMVNVLTKQVTIYDNGKSIGGINITISEAHAPSGNVLAAHLSNFIPVQGIQLANLPQTKIIADRVYTGNGIQVESFLDITDGDRLYLVAPGLLFVWPFVELGHKVHIKAKMSPTKQDIVLESLSESPRVFHVHNFFTYDEADKLIERILTIDTDTDKLQQSHVGHVSGAKKVSPHRTSENAFDQVSDTAISIRKRSFDLLRIAKYQDDMSDGLQLLRYKQKQAYISHTDYFSTQTSADWNWNPKAGGSNRFATVFLYLSNVTLGGQTVFPLSEMPEGQNHPEMSSETKTLTNSLFEKDSWEQDMVDKCSTRLASYPRKAHAILFYSQKPNGELDPMSLHGGCPVLDGTKWAANLWVWNKRRYGLDQSRNDKIQVKFINPRSFPVDLYWKETKMTTIPAGHNMPYSSYNGHTWSFRDTSGHVLYTHTLFAEYGSEQTIQVPADISIHFDEL